ncbi:chaperone protein dnaJ 20, chloroplastic-like [Solanum pennellii]|uniref:Chaperone protein dnaJ 20, chloroplastic-like n=1 Tax=Solanum pennellii TaxID=28526 RepID=A0ABM1GQU6_SOLPN|nr:chaperone protein dnaJ 20, chloroplastic-like [Solanum pennellii]
MCCNSNGVIPTSEPRFPLFSTHPPTISPNPRLFFLNNPSNHGVLRTKFVSYKAKSNLNDVVSCTDTGKSFYDLLGIPENGSLLEIKQAYKQLVRKYHPDVSPPDRVEEYTQRFIRVQEAYETLSDPGMRALYDIDMAKGLHFGFSARSHEAMEERGEWKNRWQSQLSELKRRRTYKESSNSMSWGARMRKQRDDDA